MEQYFITKDIIDSISRNPGYITTDETLLGFVIVPGTDENHNDALFFFPRVRNSRGVIYVKENFASTDRGCPYPPPCDRSFVGDCYDNDQTNAIEDNLVK